MEKSLAFDHAQGHFAQVVILNQVGFCQHFALQMAAIAIEMHLVDVRKTGFSDHRLGELINARSRYSYLHPASLRQNGLSCIAVGGRPGGQDAASRLDMRRGKRLYLQHEAR